MNTLRVVGVVVISFMLFPPAVHSADEGQQVKFEYLDSNGDGFISRSEATSNIALRERWNNIDTDKDGKLTEKEFSRFADAPTEAYPEN